MTENDKTIPLPGGAYFDLIPYSTKYWSLYRPNGIISWTEEEARAFATAMNAPAVSPSVQEGMGVKPLKWEEIMVDRGDGSSEHEGSWEAPSGFGTWYGVEMGFGSDSHVWSVKFDGDQLKDFDDPNAAKAYAQAHYDARILYALTPTPDRQKAESEQGASIPCKVPEGDEQLVDAALDTWFDNETDWRATKWADEYRACMRKVLATAPQPPVPTAPASGGSAVAVEETLKDVRLCAEEWAKSSDSYGYARGSKMPGNEISELSLCEHREKDGFGEALAALEAATRRFAASQANDGVRDAALEEAAKMERLKSERDEAQEALMRVAEEIGSTSATTALYLDVRARLMSANSSARDGVREAALEEAAKIAEVEGLGRDDDGEPADAWIAVLIAREIRALKADTKTTPGPVERAKPQGPKGMTDAELTAADIAYQQRERGDWEGSGSPLETFYDRWSDIVDEMKRRGVPVSSDETQQIGEQAERQGGL